MGFLSPGSQITINSKAGVSERIFGLHQSSSYPGPPPRYSLQPGSGAARPHSTTESTEPLWLAPGKGYIGSATQMHPEVKHGNGSLPRKHNSWSMVNFIETNDTCRQDERAPREAVATGHWNIWSGILNPGLEPCFFIYCVPSPCPPSFSQNQFCYW